jgi:hypothetical protein
MRNTVPEASEHRTARALDETASLPSSPLAERSRRGAGGPDGMVPFSFSRGGGTSEARDDSFHDPRVQKWPDDHDRPDRTNGLC